MLRVYSKQNPLILLTKHFDFILDQNPLGMVYKKRVKI